jgi:beta-glucanase (GH16 family)
MKIAVLAASILIFGFVCVQNAEWRADNWVLIWGDEFDGPNGTGPDEAKWAVESGGDGWGNNELQYYTTRRENVRQEDGNLIIEAIEEKFTGPDGVQRNYTSARINTAGRFSQTYGRFETRSKIPFGSGIWSAFWLLGNDFSIRGWPKCGEIDVMESLGLAPSRIFGSVHGPGYFERNALTSSYTLSKGRFSDDFHVFAAEWEPQRIRFYVDGLLYATMTPSDLPRGAAWVFDHPFFLLVNVAVGGNLAGTPDDSTVFPQRMLVDYVRVYSRR